MKASYQKYILNFKKPSGTSRGIMTIKETFFLFLEENGKKGIGECGILRGLSIDDRPDYEEKLNWVCQNIEAGEEWLLENLIEFPSIQFGVETAFRSFQSNNIFEIFPSEFTNAKKNIPINGLVWMGDKQFMKEQIEEKIQSDFSCIKLKIGAIEFEKELELLQFIRENYPPEKIEIRVDANGAFSANEALKKLQRLSTFRIHSIEQPIKQNQVHLMANLCKETPIPIALDEELIGIFELSEKRKLLQKIKPHYIILKPSLVGGFQGSLQWISLAEEMGIGWWITSALESNIGLNAIAQFTFVQQNPMPQGLGTGSLYTNNFESPLTVKNGFLQYDTAKNWEFDLL
ncbi:o-succinylbenzoate synthase [Flavobacterium sp. NST-5]|uniref:o-succinylbenzoate synthase n=1 Tax=Flavobacterium ichthyis TaxID=2698827 RepID=A0ABW9Z6M2_9FLAO|nr:o-succinylbenzoate synthase [Flavobacterium ichthyis]NBL64304.1 o-succinylbenzoate synthase [Flavobacterium ichthyis]